ncbi:MAG: LysM peptidoglycan-binding domain-containing protein [Sulfurovaceae bacterium]|nr:LysM peptidoglycan-binding domain-containing protein [Sulfurovaceae bacterium]
MKKIIFFMMLGLTTMVFAQESIRSANDALECVRLNFKAPKCKDFTTKERNLAVECVRLNFSAPQCQPYNQTIIASNPIENTLNDDENILSGDDNTTPTQKISLADPMVQSNRNANIQSKGTNFTSNFQSTYTTVRGDTLGKIAIKFGVAQGEIKSLNPSIEFRELKTGTDILMPLSQDKINAIVKKSKIKKKPEKHKIIAEPEGRKLKVIASAYTSTVSQTDSTPFIAAWGFRLVPGMKVIAVSRDLISQYGLTNGSKVRISGLDGYYTIRDKMNPRYIKHIDIYMGLDKRKALRWGRRSVTIYW